MTATDPGSERELRAVKDALRALVDDDPPAGGGDAVAEAADALSGVERAADAAADGAFDRVREVERAAERRGETALAADCRAVLDELDAYRHTAAGHFGAEGGRISTDTRDAGLMSGDGLPADNE